MVMGFFLLIMRFLPFLLTLVAIVFLVARMRGFNPGARPFVTGRLVSNTLAEDKIEKRLKILAWSAAIIFVVDSVILVVLLMSAYFSMALIVVGCVLGCLVLVLGIVGIIFSQILTLPNRKFLFTLLFTITTILGLIISTLFSITAYLLV